MQRFSELCKGLKLKSPQIAVLDEAIESNLTGTELDIVLATNLFTQKQAEAVRAFYEETAGQRAEQAKKSKEAVDAYDSVELIMGKFDFSKVYAYMVLTGWKWRGEVPEVDDIRATARVLLNEVSQAPKYKKEGDEGRCSGTGGLYAYRFIFGGKVCYKLTFEPVHYSNY